jgi:hypothetical protein
MITSSLWLDDYNDIFSDFDSRHYPSRRISEDFLYELRMDMRRDKQMIEELLLFVPEHEREQTTERIIVDRLQAFFTEQYTSWRDKYRKKLNISLIMALSGIIIMALDAMAIFWGIRILIIKLLSTVMEPASWFLLWTSVDYLIYDLKDLKKERDFYRKLSKAKIIFRTA